MTEPNNNPVLDAINRIIGSKTPAQVQPITKHAAMVQRLRENLPEELKAAASFVRYKVELKDDGHSMGKIPYGKDGRKVGWNTPEQWATFEECLDLLTDKFDGIGYVFSDPTIHAVDFDKCRNVKTGEITNTVTGFLSAINSWTEISVSGNGLHTFFKGDVTRYKSLDKAHIQYWHPSGQKRFFALTGDVLQPYNTLRDGVKEYTYLGGIAAHASKKIREELERVDPELFAIVSAKPEPEDNTQTEEPREKSKTRTRMRHKEFDLEHFLEYYGFKIVSRTEDPNVGLWLRVDWCPRKDDAHATHNSYTTNFLLSKDGGLGFHCQSSGCQNTTTIHDAIKLLEDGPKGKYPKPIWANQAQPRKLFMSTSNLDEVGEPEVVWTVQDVLMAGVLNLFIGDPDIGKSFMACHYIAQLTREGKRVIIICREDHESVWKKRIRAAEGVLSLVTFVNGVRDEYDPTYKEEWMLDNATHVEFLHQCIKAMGAALVVLDPLADLAANTDLNASGPVRKLFQPLNRVAQETGVCLLVNTHTTKAIVDSVIKSAAHSYQVMASAAVAWFFMEDRDAPGRSLFMCARNKFGGKKAGWRYSITDASETDVTGVINFQGKEYRNVNGMLREIGDRTQDGTKAAQCRKWLTNLLKDGPKPSPDCNTAAKLMEFDSNTLNRACQSLKVIRDSKTWRIEPKEQAEQGNVEFDHNQHKGEERITA